VAERYTKEIDMPQYVFVCHACNKEFTQTMHISEMLAAKIKCPHCGSVDVKQQVAAFAAVTSRKS
jgi:putative FmdB family regulatory protein